MLLGLAVAAGVLLQTFNADLPDYDRLAQYEPPVMTRIHAADGQLVAEHAKRTAALSADPGGSGLAQGGVPVCRGQEFL